MSNYAMNEGNIEHVRGKAVAKAPMAAGRGRPLPYVIGNQSYLSIVQRIVITDEPEKPVQEVIEEAIENIASSLHKWTDIASRIKLTKYPAEFSQNVFKDILSVIKTQFILNIKDDFTLTKAELEDLIICAAGGILDAVNQLLEESPWTSNFPFDQIRGYILHPMYENILTWDYIKKANTYRTDVEKQIHHMMDAYGMSREQVLGQIRDTKWQGQSTFIMEDEAGYTGAMLDALTLSYATDEEPVNAALYGRIHDTAVRGVQGMMGGQAGYRPLGEGVKFGIREGWNMSDAGLREYRQKKEVFLNNRERLIEERFWEARDDMETIAPEEEELRIHALTGMLTEELGGTHLMGAGPYSPSPFEESTVPPPGALPEMKRSKPNVLMKNRGIPLIKPNLGGSKSRQLVQKPVAYFPPVNKRRISPYQQLEPMTAEEPSNEDVMINTFSKETSTELLAERVLWSYNQRITACRDDSEKLRVIADVCQTLD